MNNQILFCKDQEEMERVFFLIFIVIQLQLSAFSPHPSTPLSSTLLLQLSKCQVNLGTYGIWESIPDIIDIEETHLRKVSTCVSVAKNIRSRVVAWTEGQRAFWQECKVVAM